MVKLTDPQSQWETNTPHSESTNRADRKDVNSTINKYDLTENFPLHQEHVQHLMSFYSCRVRLIFVLQGLEMELFPSFSFYEYSCCEHLCTNLCVKKIFVFSFLLGKYSIPIGETAGSRGRCMVNIFRNCQLPKVVLSFDISTSNARRS